MSSNNFLKLSKLFAVYNLVFLHWLVMHGGTFVIAYRIKCSATSVMIIPELVEVDGLFV